MVERKEEAPAAAKRDKCELKAGRVQSNADSGGVRRSSSRSRLELEVEAQGTGTD